MVSGAFAQNLLVVKSALFGWWRVGRLCRDLHGVALTWCLVLVLELALPLLELPLAFALERRRLDSVIVDLRLRLALNLEVGGFLDTSIVVTRVLRSFDSVRSWMMRKRNSAGTS